MAICLANISYALLVRKKIIKYNNSSIIFNII